jgi:D-arabinose 1-dehydrogenase-like Zn-dependent alcohol dehydrogenase
VIAPEAIEVWAPSAPGAPLAPRLRPAPLLGPDDLLVAVEAAVVGAPETWTLDEGAPFAPGGAAVGTVVAAGSAAAHRLGERALVGPARACFECDVCRRGHPAVCPARVRLGLDADGALASHVVARARATTALAGPLAGAVPGPEAALLAREAALAYEMVVRAGVAPGETTVWVGGGAIARLGEAIARAKGATAWSPAADERALAPATAAALMRARLLDAGATALPHKVFETSARAAGRARAAALAGPGATLVLLAGVAAGARDATPVPAAILDLDALVVGVAGAHPDLVPELAALAARGELDLAGAADIRPFADLPAILAELRTGRAAPDRAAIVTRG